MKQLTSLIALTCPGGRILELLPDAGDILLQPACRLGHAAVGVVHDGNPKINVSVLAASVRGKQFRSLED